MSGGGVQIFSMGIVMMLLFNPFKAIANINNGIVVILQYDLFNLGFFIVFAPFAEKDSNAHSFSTLLPQKLLYILCNFLHVALGLWKCKSMGLLPTGTADWLAFEVRGEVRLCTWYALQSLTFLSRLRKYIYLNRSLSLLFIDFDYNSCIIPSFQYYEITLIITRFLLVSCPLL